MLTCPKCSYDNELGRVFCHQCGAKLDLDKIKPTSGGRIVRRKGRWSARCMVHRLFVVVVLAFLGWGIYWMSRTPEMQPVKPTARELSAVDEKRSQLERAVVREAPLKMVITASELSAYLANRALEDQTVKGAGVVPIALQAVLGDGTVTLNFLGTAKLGDVLSRRFFVSYTGVPTVENGRFEFRPVAAEIGQVAIHPSILNATGWMRGYFGKLLEKQGHEQELLDQLSSISVARDRIQLTYQPKTDAAKHTAR